MNIPLSHVERLLPQFLDIPGSWVGHTPFASWLIAEMNPACFVELGTHSGNSWFAFCRSVALNGLQTECHAVDTWAGDAQASFYSEEVYTRVERINSENYADFATLHRTTFDEAAVGFADGSVNLLHIDGLHTCEAARHDFTTWLPKLAAGAVVLFHDIEARHDDFGVYKVWEELCREYQYTFAFAHSWGLGVLQLPPAEGEKPLALFTDSGVAEQVQTAFTSLGENVMHSYQGLEDSLNCRVALAEEQREKEEFLAQREHFRNECQRLEELTGELVRQRDQHLFERNHFIKEAENNAAQCAALQAELATAQRGLTEQDSLRQQAAELTRRNREITATRWWRLGERLRRLRRWNDHGQ